MEIRRVDNQKISIHQSQARKIHSISKDGILKRAERPEDLLSLEKMKVCFKGTSDGADRQSSFSFPVTERN
jgi:hypothetical protein